MADDVEAELQKWFADAKKVVVAGIGNPIRQDDYVGLKIVQALQGKVRPEVCLLECETVPESYLSDIENFHPSHVLLIDTALLGGNVGDARLVDAEAVKSFSAVSSHILPLRIFCEYVKAATGAKIAMLLIKPKSMNFGEGLSCEVQLAVKELTRILLRILG